MKKTILFIALLAAGLSQAQDPLTLKDAINYALQNKSEARKARLDVENSEYQIKEVRSQALPNISANGNITYNPILQESALPAEFFGGEPGSVVLVPFGQEWIGVGGLSLTQNLFDMGVFTGLKAARSTREFYKVNAELTDEQVIERVATAYYEVFVARERLAVADSNYVNSSKVRDIIKGQFDNGLARKIDLDRTTVKLYNIDTQRQRARNDVQLRENALKFLMGMPLETPIVLAPEPIEIKPLAMDAEPDLSNRTEMKVLERQEELLTYQKKSMQAGYYPTLSLNANYSYQALGSSFPLFATMADGVYWTDYSSIGLNLRVPIFSGFGTKARVQKADIELRKHQEDMTNTQLALKKEYYDALANIENNLATLRTQRENAALAQSVLSDTKNNYYNGLATLTDLLDSENALVEAQNNYNTALLEYKKAEIQLIKSKGELKTLAQ
jgi:outer membrane protein